MTFPVLVAFVVGVACGVPVILAEFERGRRAGRAERYREISEALERRGLSLSHLLVNRGRR